jgi:hypothetical protein
MAADRQDIDALLIGALYGELDGDERARLDAHLASHPQDRSALEDMRSTRAMLRDAEVASLLGAAEPSPAISARLLQEAARRAPAKAAGGGVFAFLSTLFRPLVASPALSAAAALVIVGGAAGILYSRGALEKGEPMVDRGPAAGSAPQRGAPAATTARTETMPGVIDDYRVSLDDQGQAKGTAADPNAAAAGSTESESDGMGDGAGLRGNLASRDGTISGGDRLDAAKQNELAFQADGKAKAGKKSAPASVKLGATGDAAAATRPGYIAVDPVGKDAPTVLTLDGERADSDRAASGESKNIATDKSRAAGAGAVAAEGRAPSDSAPAPAPPAAPKPAQVARDQGKAGGTYNPVAAAALETWARDQHTRMVKLVNQGKCTDAGAIGADIARKAPDYYQANVANDRQVRSCRSYVDRARRAKSEDAKTKAAAPRAPQPDVQHDLESSH